MTAKEKIILFMKKKQDILTQYRPCFKDKYFNYFDEKEIQENWSEEECDRVLDEIVIAIKNDNWGLYAATCPFCYYTPKNDCYQCSYPNYHGGCDPDGCSVDWNNITLDDSVHYEFLPEKYNEIIESIEHE